VTILTASLPDEPLIQRLLARSRRVYKNSGHEDLHALIEQQGVWLGVDQQGAWGVIALQHEERPLTLPAGAPSHTYLRTLAVDYGHAPVESASCLLEAALLALPDRALPTLLIAYGGEQWLTDGLVGAGFGLAEQVQFFRLERLQRLVIDRTQIDASISLRPMAPPDIDAVTQLDAETFDPLWHFGAKELWSLLLSARLQVASLDGRIVGYSALSIGAQEAHLARLAVHPQAQGRGVGRRLLIDCLDQTRASGVTTLALNTQVSNTRSQQLYRQFGFQPTRQIVPIFTRLLNR
jgi:ribosomal-protein-alanine N-acetyltransferase